MNENIRWIGISFLLVVALISSISFLGNGVAPTGMVSFHGFMNTLTGNIVGLPDCIASFTLSSPDTVTVYSGMTTNMDVQLSDVKCGLTHVSLDLVDFPSEYYSVSPETYDAVYPSTAHSFTVSFKMPDETPGRVYLTQVRLLGDNMVFYGNDIEVKIAENPEKPAVPSSEAQIESLVLTETDGRFLSILSPRAWLLLGLTAVVAAIALVLYNYVPHKAKEDEFEL
ncbi:MAG: hypothetical protein ABIF92_00660 [archaeon]